MKIYFMISLIILIWYHKYWYILYTYKFRWFDLRQNSKYTVFCDTGSSIYERGH